MKALVAIRDVNHSTICRAELTHLFGRLDPAHRGTKTVLGQIRRVIEDIPAHRLAAPSPTAMGGAGMLAGLVARPASASRGETLALLNDARLYLQSLERGWTVLTRNSRDYDLFDQLPPAGRVLFYNQV